MQSLRDEGMSILFISSELEEVSATRSGWSSCEIEPKLTELVGDNVSQSIMHAIAGHDRGGSLRNGDKRWWSSLVWPVTGLLLLLLFNLLFTEGFFHIEVRDGRLYGVLIDILNHGSKVMLLALGMALVIATGGVDLSVGAVMAIAGAVAAQLINMEGVPFPVVIAAALGVAVLRALGTVYWWGPSRSSPS